MTGLADRIGVVLVGACMVGLGYLYVDSLQARLAKAESDNRAALRAVADRDDIISQLRELAKTNEVAAAKLEGQRDRIRDQLGNREMEMRKLQNENAEIRAWAAAAVPEPVSRLRNHGTFTGAASYLEFMSKGAALHPARRSGEQ